MNHSTERDREFFRAWQRNPLKTGMDNSPTKRARNFHRNSLNSKNWFTIKKLKISNWC